MAGGVGEPESTLPERLALLIEDEGLRRTAARCGINHTYLARIVRGQQPTIAPLEALAAAYPEAFPVIPKILAAFPQAARLPGRPWKSREESYSATGALGWSELMKRPQIRLDVSGRTRRTAGALDGLLGPFSESEVDYLPLVERDWVAPEVRRGDVLLVSVNTLPHPGGIVLVEDTAKRSHSRRMSVSRTGQTVYASADPERFPDLSPGEARITGVAVGWLRSEPLRTGKSHREVAIDHGRLPVEGAPDDLFRFKIPVFFAAKELRFYAHIDLLLGIPNWPVFPEVSAVF